MHAENVKHMCWANAKIRRKSLLVAAKCYLLAFHSIIPISEQFNIEKISIFPTPNYESLLFRQKVNEVVNIII